MRLTATVTSNTSAVVLVTGASSGLGLALSKKLLPTEYRLLLTARKNSLGRFAAAGITANERVRIRTLDVTSSAERDQVVREADETWGGVDVLINNAGVAYRTVVEHFNEADDWEQMDVNFRGPMELIRLVLPGMRRKRAGRILNVSSVGGMMAMPTMALYSASKFALEGATESLWYEVRPWNIHVSLVQPGFIHSDSFRNTRYTEASRRAADDPVNPYHRHYEQMAALIARLMAKASATPEQIADTILRTMRNPSPPLRVPATWDAHLFALLRRFLPRWIYHRFLYGQLPGVGGWGNGPEA
ncbi:MAG: SDR family oxidoreductase [Verrucomicrobia bacterium]|nr:SDR family oxidoreductase [Verrucomicrobiota bacterium]